MRNRAIALGFLLLASTTSAFADDSTVPYLGGSLGVNQDNMRLRDPTYVYTNFWATGLTGSIFGGFAWSNDQFYVAGEGFGTELTARSSTKTINTGSGTTSAILRMRYSYGGSILPGLKIKTADDMVVYIRLGAVKTRFELHQTVVPSGSTSNISKTTASGGQIGIGVQGYVARAIALRGEYDYSGYRTYTAFNNKITPHDNQLSIGLIYQFC